MTRWTAALLACAITGIAQPEAAPGGMALLDVAVLDAAGRPVTNLTPADFAVTQAGTERAVERLTVLDAVRHTASSAGSLPAIEITPDQIHRTIAIVVDDLCMTADGLREARRELYALSGKLTPGDRVAILRSSSGTAREQQFSDGGRQLAAAIDGIEYLGGSVSRQACGAAAWITVAHALAGLQALDGRKAVVLLSEDLPAPEGVSGLAIGKTAARAAAAIYQTAICRTSGGARAFSESNGGACGVDLERVLRETAAYYVLGVNAAGSARLTVSLRRPELTLRSRAEPMSLPARYAFLAPRPSADSMREAMNSPFEGTEIGLQVTPMFLNTAKDGAVLTALLHIGARGLGYLRDEKGAYRLDFDLVVGSAVAAGTTPLFGEEHAITLTGEQFRRVLDEGLAYTVTVRARSSGAREIRAIVADRLTGGMGTASAYVEVHDLATGDLSLSGIVMEGGPGLKAGLAVRRFRAGQALTFSCQVYNAATREDGSGEIEVQTRMFAAGREIFSGKPLPVRFAAAGDPKRHQVSGKLTLDPSAGPGRYILVVNVKEKTGAGGRTASQFIDFTIEP